MIVLFALSGLLALISGALVLFIGFKLLKLLGVEYEEQINSQRQRIRTKARI